MPCTSEEKGAGGVGSRAGKRLAGKVRIGYNGRLRRDKEQEMSHHNGWDGQPVAHYTCFKTENEIVLDGDLTKNAWRSAPRSSRFVDLVTGEPGYWETRMAALWDDERFYVGIWIEEPHVRAQFTKRDSPLYLENDVEVFIAGPDCYYELQINALGTIYEVFYVWQDAYRRGGFFDKPEFELVNGNVDILGGFQDSLRYKKHPRGKRWAFMDWDFPGLRSAVRIDGTLNDGSDVDRGWTVELAFPWKGMETLAQERPLPPENGDTWRMDFFRFEALSRGGISNGFSPGWSLNKHGVYDSHIPELFPCVHFSTQKPGHPQ